MNEEKELKKYGVVITDSSRELNAVERLKFKDTNDAKNIDDIIAGEVTFLELKVAEWVMLKVHNESSETKDYNVLLLVSENGDKYKTGSKSFIDSFSDINDELIDDGINISDVNIKAYKKPSKNFANKSFLLCSIA